jgi:hypothetical protein
VLTVVVLGGTAWAQEALPQEVAASASDRSPWQIEYSVYGGTVTASGIIGEDINATGDHEPLTARLKPSPFAGVKVGIHGDRVGLDGGVLRSTNKLEVQNVFGVPFPNHGENITMIKADCVVYPIRRSFAAGLFRPYASVGAGGAFSSVDLDNIGDQDNFSRPLVSFGLGAKFQLGGKDGVVQLEVLFRNEHIFGRAPIRASNLRTVSVGIVYTQFRGLQPTS